MTTEVVEALRKTISLVEQQDKKITALAATQATLIGVMQAKKLMSAREVEVLYDFIEHSLPDGQSAEGMEMLQALKEAVAAVLKSAEPG